MEMWRHWPAAPASRYTAFTAEQSATHRESRRNLDTGAGPELDGLYIERSVTGRVCVCVLFGPAWLSNPVSLMDGWRSAPVMMPDAPQVARSQYPANDDRDVHNYIFSKASCLEKALSFVHMVVLQVLRAFSPCFGPFTPTTQCRRCPAFTKDKWKGYQSFGSLVHWSAQEMSLFTGVPVL